MVQSFHRFAYRRAALAAAAFLAAVAITSLASPAAATLPYSRKEDKKCYHCHVDWQNDKHALTEQGQYYLDNNYSLEGLPAHLQAGPPPPPEEPEEESKGMPVGVMAGMLFFAAMIALIVISIFKTPAKAIEPDKTADTPGPPPEGGGSGGS